MKMDSEAAADRLNDFFRPRNVAMVGASDRSAWSALLHSRFPMWGHQGQLFAVNRNGVPAHGVAGYKSCVDIPEPVDMAYIYVPAQAVPEAIRDAAAAGIRNAVVLTSGFSEAGDEGIALQNEVTAVARACGMRLLGPNSLGFVNVVHNSVTTVISTREPIRAGRLGIVSQSGAIANEIVSFAHSQGIGIGFACATGNEADLGMADIVEYLVGDPGVGAILLYVEAIKDPVRFAEAAARAFAAAKPIVLLKLGRSSVSAEIGQAHTGSLVGDDGVFDAMCRLYGISRVSSLDELVITGALLDDIGPINPPRIGMTSLSGGACAIYADLAEEHGLAVPQFAPETKAALREVLPFYASTLNPLDVTGAVVNDPSLWSKVLPILTRDPGIGLIVTTTVVPNTPVEVLGLGDGIKAMIEGYRVAGRKSVITGMTLQDKSEARRAFMEEAGLDVFLADLDVGVRALAHLQRWSERIVEGLGSRAVSVREASARPVGERETLAYLAAHGVPVIPTTLVTSAEEAAAAIERTGGTMVMKIASPDIAHKTEAGGVRLNIIDSEQGRRVYEEIVASARAYAADARIDGVVVAPMRGPATELIVGVARDPDWGPVIALGMGGILAEALADSQVRLLPVTKDEVRDMLMSLRMAKLLRGFRGTPAADLDRLAAAIVAIGDAALALGPGLAALEVNPLRVQGGEIEALDGLTVYAAA
jgi:acyl-CoA synthetase (NDP forming)